MSTLLRFKEWLSLEEATRHLSSLCEEQVTQADILRIALDGHLQLSVHFVNHARGRPGMIVPLENAKKHSIPISAIQAVPELKNHPELLEGIVSVETSVFDGIYLGEEGVLELEQKIISLQGVWDLAMIGAERLDVEHRYQSLTNGPPVELTFIDGAIVSNGEEFAQIQEHYGDNEYLRDKSRLSADPYDPSNYYPAGRLPDDAVFVVRTKVLEAFRLKLSDTEHDGLAGC